MSDSQSEILAEYRKDLVVGRKKAEEELDKAVLALSSASIVASFAVVKGIDHSLLLGQLLLLTWGAWALSITSIVLSFIASRAAHTKSIKLIDTDTFYALGVNPEKGWNTACWRFKLAGMTLYLLGIGLFVVFISFNLGAINGKATTETKPDSTAKASNTAAANNQKRHDSAAAAPPKGEQVTRVRQSINAQSDTLPDQRPQH